MARTIERGRWATTRVARLYICDGLSQTLEHKIDPAMRRRLQREVRQVATYVRAIATVYTDWCASQR